MLCTTLPLDLTFLFYLLIPLLLLASYHISLFHSNIPIISSPIDSSFNQITPANQDYTILNFLLILLYYSIIFSIHLFPFKVNINLSGFIIYEYYSQFEGHYKNLISLSVLFKVPRYSNYIFEFIIILLSINLIIL